MYCISLVFYQLVHCMITHFLLLVHAPYLLRFKISLGDVTDEFEILSVFEVFGVMQPNVETVVLKEVVRLEARRRRSDECRQRLRHVTFRFA